MPSLEDYETLLRRLGQLERETERLSAQETGRFVPLTTPLTSTSWDGDSYSTVSTSTELDLYEVFGVPKFAKAVRMQIVCQDSAAWGTGGLVFQCGPTSGNYFAFDTRPAGGDVLISNHAVVPCSLDANNNPTVWYRINASGSLTMDIWVRIWGYWL